MARGGEMTGGRDLPSPPLSHLQHLQLKFSSQTIRVKAEKMRPTVHMAPPSGGFTSPKLPGDLIYKCLFHIVLSTPFHLYIKPIYN